MLQNTYSSFVGCDRTNTNKASFTGFPQISHSHIGSPTTSPTAWPPMKAGQDLGVIDANVSVKLRPIVTAGFAKEVEEENQ